MSDPAKRARRDYSKIDDMSTDALKEILRLDSYSEGEENDIDAEVLLHIMEVIAKREQEEPSGRFTDTDTAWGVFNEKYRPYLEDKNSLYDDSEGEKPIVKHKGNFKVRNVIRPALIAAAVFICLIAGMIFAQAAGINIFGTVARWTDETFHFVSSAQVDDDPAMMEFKDLLETNGIPKNFAPTWSLEGFEARSPEIITTAVDNSISITYVNQADDRNYLVEISRYSSAEYLELTTFEKDPGSVEQYKSGDKMFYIFSNQKSMTATWSGGTLMIVIRGALTRDEIKKIVDSIGE